MCQCYSCNRSLLRTLSKNEAGTSSGMFWIFFDTKSWRKGRFCITNLADKSYFLLTDFSKRDIFCILSVTKQSFLLKLLFSSTEIAKIYLTEGKSNCLSTVNHAHKLAPGRRVRTIWGHAVVPGETKDLQTESPFSILQDQKTSIDAVSKLLAFHIQLE